MVVGIVVVVGGTVVGGSGVVVVGGGGYVAPSTHHNEKWCKKIEKIDSSALTNGRCIDYDDLRLLKLRDTMKCQDKGILMEE